MSKSVDIELSSIKYILWLQAIAQIRKKSLHLFSKGLVVILLLVDLEKINFADLAESLVVHC